MFRPPARKSTWIGVLIIVALFGSNRARGQDSPIKDDERVVFFPTYAHQTPDASAWVLQIHGWIFEPETDSHTRRAGLGTLRRFLGLEKDAADTALFKQRAAAFLVDNERGKELAIQFGDRRFDVGESGPNGHFHQDLRFPAEEVRKLSDPPGTENDWVAFEVVTPRDDARSFQGRVQLIDPTGVSVISDIDDTTKISNVDDYQALLKNTFLRDFEAVPQMAEVYGNWAASGVCFHYVTASPWQLYEPLATFLQTAGFPAGSFHMKYFRWKDSTVTALFASSESLKRGAIESILAAFPRRRFILVGDSGEIDPEIYGALARRHPRQIVRILIRDVSDESAEAQRYRHAFADVERERWTVFKKADEIETALP